MPLLRCPKCLHVAFVRTAGPHACPSCDYGRPTTVPPRLAPQTEADYRLVYEQEAVLQLEAEAEGKAPVDAHFGNPGRQRASELRAVGKGPFWRRKAKGDAVGLTEVTSPGVPEGTASRTQSRVPVKASETNRDPPAREVVVATKTGKQPRVNEPRKPGTSRKNWFARTSFGTVSGAAFILVAGALGAIERAQVESGIDLEERLGVELTAAVGWPTLATAILTGVLGVWWARRNPQAGGLIRSLAGIVLGGALAAALVLDVQQAIDPILAP